MENKITELLEKVDKLALKLTELESEVKALKEGSLGTGVYLEGTPEYAKEYIVKKEGDK